MSVLHAQIQTPLRRPVPTGAMLVGQAIAELALALRRTWRRSQERRAAAAAQRLAGLDRQEVLALARRYQYSQPSFAKDLYAAATRDLS
jgi:hypothetical protein